MNAIEAKTGPGYWRRIGVVWGMFGLMGLAITAAARMPAMGIFGLLMMAAPAFLLYRRRVTWAARFDGEGVTLMNGKRLPWSELEKVVDVHVVRGGAKWHNHYELVFRSGQARVFDRMLANADEVLGLLKALERGENPFTGARRQA